MIIVRTRKALRHFLENHSSSGGSIGFVPTMGALHPGHLSLVKKAIDATDVAVCSIFINPTQFNDPSDYEKYPVTIENDIRMLEQASANYLFLPAVSELYPEGTRELEKYDLGELETILEGKYRPGHFQGVCQVMHRLLDCVQPQQLFMGQKDYQQCLVVERLLNLIGSHTTLVRCATVREAGGLAMSSRNLRLTGNDRHHAKKINEVLQVLASSYHSASLRDAKELAEQQLSAAGFKVDYIEVADAETLELLSEWKVNGQMVCLTAAFLDNVRLIDNVLMSR